MHSFNNMKWDSSTLTKLNLIEFENLISATSILIEFFNFLSDFGNFLSRVGRGKRKIVYTKAAKHQAHKGAAKKFP